MPDFTLHSCRELKKTLLKLHTLACVLTSNPHNWRYSPFISGILFNSVGVISMATYFVSVCVCVCGFRHYYCERTDCHWFSHIRKEAENYDFSPSGAPVNTEVISAQLKQMSLPLDSFTWQDHKEMSTNRENKNGTPENSFHISLKYQIIFSFSIALEDYFFT